MKYFADGLLSLALVLTLLRSEDVNNCLNSLYSSDYSQLQEVFLGPLSGYTQTHIHSPTWQDEIGGYMNLKTLDSYYENSVFRDLHSLAHYRRFEGVTTHMNAFLVSVPPTATLPSESASTSSGAHSNSNGESASSSATPNSNSEDDNNNNVLSSSSSNSPNTTEDTVQSTELPETSGLQNAIHGSELTEEDMSLIEVLWRQDIDLGIGREMYDTSLRKELEKERELELHKERELEKIESQKQEEENKLNQQQDQQQDVEYVVDAETGELIPVPPGGNVGNQAVEPAQPLVDEVQPAQLGPDDEGFSIEEAMRLLEQQQADVTMGNSSPENSTVHLQQQLDALIETSSQVPQNPVQTQGVYDRQSSFEMRWQDVANLISIQPSNASMPGLPVDMANNTYAADMSHMNHSFANNSVILQNASFTSMGLNGMSDEMGLNDSMTSDVAMENMTSHALVQNASLVPAEMNNNTAGLFSTNMNHTGFTPLVTPSTPSTELLSSLLPPSNSTSVDGTSLFNLDTHDLIFPNLTAPNIVSHSYNNTELMLQELLDDDLEDINFTSIALTQGLQSMRVMGSSSSESAVSTVSSTSPVQDFNDSSSVASSPFDGLEGATGGSESPNPDSKKQLKYEPVDTYNYSGYAVQSRERNQSTSSNDTNYGYQPASIRQVNHNHTYPLQPGQQPKERKSAERDKKHRIISTRDEKRAKTLKIPFSTEDIIHSPVERFNEMLTKYSLTETQLQLIRDIRRRGKNKVAAQNCRKRKIEVIDSLEDEVIKLRENKETLLRQQRMVERERKEMSDKFDHLYKEVFRSLRDEHGHPYDPQNYSLQQTGDGNVFLVPNNGTGVEKDHEEKQTRKRKATRKH